VSSSSPRGTGGWLLLTVLLAVATLGATRVVEGKPSSGVLESSLSASADSVAVADVVARYHAALAAGDSLSALALLADDAVVLESGGIETRAEYRSHHLSGDIEFARALGGERGPLRVTLRGDVAWTTGSSVVQGQYQGRAINSVGAELMVLSRESDGWKIRAIHWSSRTRRSS
jgi:ketosteroid isomerase-like protein